MSTSSSANETLTAAVTEAVEIKPVCVPDTDSVFPDPVLQVRNKHSLIFIVIATFFFCDIKAELQFLDRFYSHCLLSGLEKVICLVRWMQLYVKFSLIPFRM